MCVALQITTGNFLCIMQYGCGCFYLQFFLFVDDDDIYIYIYTCSSGYA